MLCCGGSSDPAAKRDVEQELRKEDPEATTPLIASQVLGRDCQVATKAEKEDSQQDFLVDTLVEDFLAEKGIFLLLWAEEGSACLTKALGVMYVVLVWGVMVSVPSLLMQKAAPSFDAYQESEKSHSPQICVYNSFTTALMSEKVWAGVFLMFYLVVQLTAQFSTPRILAYVTALRGTSLNNICHGYLHFGLLASALGTFSIFIGTYFLFVRKNAISDLVLNCVALTFCIEASAKVAKTRKSMGPLGKALTKSSRNIDALVEAAKGSAVHAEWNSALENESWIASFFLWPLAVSSRCFADYAYCIIFNFVRLSGLFCALVLIPNCLTSKFQKDAGLGSF